MDESNRTKFTLIFSNVSEKDILLREEFDEWAKKYPDNLKVVYYVDKGDKDWKGISQLTHPLRRLVRVDHLGHRTIIR